MDHDLQIIHDRWADLTQLERGTASWVVEALGDRHRGLLHFDDETHLEDVLAFLSNAADKVWHCDCCPRRPTASRP